VATRLQRLRAEVIEKRGRHCSYCGVGPLYKRALHLDHVTPQKLGGKTEFANLRPACSHCNTKKSSRRLSDYIVIRLAEIDRERSKLVAIGTKLGVVSPPD